MPSAGVERSIVPCRGTDKTPLTLLHQGSTATYPLPQYGHRTFTFAAPSNCALPLSTGSREAVTVYVCTLQSVSTKALNTFAQRQDRSSATALSPGAFPS